jgi:hypothetical protein
MTDATTGRPDEYQVTCNGEHVMRTPDVKVAYRRVADLLADGHLAPGAELRIIFVANPDGGRGRREYTVSLNWVQDDNISA